jgi:hypothetical protein
MELLTPDRKRSAVRWLLLGVLSTSGCNCFPSSDLDCGFEDLERPDAGKRWPWFCLCDPDEMSDPATCFGGDGGPTRCICDCKPDSGVPADGGHEPPRSDSGPLPEPADAGAEDAGVDDAG